MKATLDDITAHAAGVWVKHPTFALVYKVRPRHLCLYPDGRREEVEPDKFEAFLKRLIVAGQRVAVCDRNEPETSEGAST